MTAQTLSLAFLLASSLLLAVSARALDHSPNGVETVSTKGGKAVKQTKAALDGSFWHQSGETYGHHQGRYFRPAVSSTFSLIKLDNVNVTFLDNTNLRGYDAADMATLGQYTVQTRMGMIEHCNSRNFDDVDGILGFGWADQPRSAALLKTLTQADRPGWDIFGQPFAGNGSPMPRKFTFTANNELGELQLGGHDPALVQEEFVVFPMTGENVYGIDIHSITYGGVELLHFQDSKPKKSFVGEFDSGTTCLLLPNTDVKGNFTTSPFGILAHEQMKGERHPLLYHARDVYGNVHTYHMSFNECVEPTDETMILGDPFFRKFAVMHDMEDLSNKRMGLAPRNPSYQLGATTDRSILTPGHAPQQQMFAAKGESGVTKIHATRKMRDHKFTQALHETKKSLAAASELHEHPTMLVDKVAVKSQSMVTYNIQLAIGSPPQPLDVIFDTGSFMLAVFAEPPPAGMKPLLSDKKDAKKDSKAASHSEKKTVAPHPPKPSIHAPVVTARKGRSTATVSRVELDTSTLMQSDAVAMIRPQGMMPEAVVTVVTVCSAMLVGALAVALRRRRAVPLVPTAQQDSYGTC